MRRDPRRARLVFALLLLTSFTFLTVDVRSGRDGVMGGIRSAIGDVFSPVGDAVSGVFRPVGDAFSAGFHSQRDRKKQKALELQVLKLQRQLAARAQAEVDQKAVAALADVAYRGDYDIVPATVIGSGAPVKDFQQIVTIDVGSIDGVKKDQPVMTGDGLVGKIVAVEAKQSQVALLTDRTFLIGVQQVDNASETGVETVHGQGQGRLLSFALEDTRTPLKKGARLVTYPAGTFQGLPVGEVESITSVVGGTQQTGLVRPYANLDTLDFVGVVVSQARGGPRSIISPSPSPTPAPPPSASPSGSPASGATASVTPGSAATTTPGTVTRTSAPPVVRPSPSSSPRSSLIPSRAPNSSVKASGASASRSRNSGP